MAERVAGLEGAQIFREIDASESFLTPHYCLYNALQIHLKYGHRIFLGYICRNTSSCYKKADFQYYQLMDHAFNVTSGGKCMDFSMTSKKGAYLLANLQFAEPFNPLLISLRSLQQ